MFCAQGLPTQHRVQVSSFRDEAWLYLGLGKAFQGRGVQRSPYTGGGERVLWVEGQFGH